MFSCGPYEFTNDNDIQNIININSCNSGGIIETQNNGSGNSETVYYTTPSTNTNYLMANCHEISNIDISNYDISTSQIVIPSNLSHSATIINAELSNNLVIIPPLIDLCLNLPIILNLFSK